MMMLRAFRPKVEFISRKANGTSRGFPFPDQMSRKGSLGIRDLPCENDSGLGSFATKHTLWECLSSLCIAGIKHHDHKQLGEEMSSCSLHLIVHQEGTQGRNLETRTEAEVMEDYFLQVYCLPGFLSLIS